MKGAVYLNMCSVQLVAEKWPWNLKKKKINVRHHDMFSNIGFARSSKERRRGSPISSLTAT